MTGLNSDYLLKSFLQILHTVSISVVPIFVHIFIDSVLGTPGSRPGHHNVSILNLANCAEIKVDEECKESPGGPMPEVNIQKLDERRKMQIERKKKLITAFKAGISPEGQKLFQYINRT